MYSIGTFLRELREEKGLHLQEVHQKTNIDLSLLSRIENGKRLPTKEQILQLAGYYESNQSQMLIHWLSDNVINEVQEKEYGLQALQAAEEIFLYRKSRTLFPNISTEKLIRLESRRYIGSKAKLTEWILKIILSETENCKSLFDVFAGTASVAKAAFKHFDKVMINDILPSNNIIYKAFFEISKWNVEKVENILYHYNTLNIDDLEDNYFSINFGNKFFEYKNAKLIGFIREDLELRKNDLTAKEFSILLTTLIYNIDKIANTVGHFDAYIKKPIKYQRLQLRLIQPTEFSGIEIYQENANLLSRKLKADIAYIDPPYNSRQYSRFYHVYDNLVTWKKPELHGVALKPQAENMSVYCTVGAKKAFKDLVDNLDTLYLAVSYNNTYASKSKSSKNKITLEDIESILKQKGETKVFECAHRFFNTGKTEFDNHKELLFITKVNGK
ncbi:MAG: DNA adenine methylase [Saprospiraceae bacterium]|nr:DNA adenine methylase [Saprospiraceae bacterium]